MSDWEYRCRHRARADESHETKHQRFQMETYSSLAEIKHEFILQATTWETALEEGNSKKANREHSIVKSLVTTIRDMGQSGQNALLELIDHRSRGTRYWAAIYLVRDKPTEALATLHDLSSGMGAIAMSASTVVELYANGEMEIP